MVILSSTVIRKRSSRRIIGDLPIDPDELELDDPVLIMVMVREILVFQQREERGKRPAERTPRFGIPSTPLMSRLRSASGLESFHLSIGKTLRGSAAGYDSYATRGTKSDLEMQAREPTTASARDLDGYMLDHGADDDATTNRLTNLDQDDEVRARQWSAIEQEEYRRRPNCDGGPPRIAIRYEAAPDFLTGVARRNECPAGLRDMILRERDRIASGRSLPKQQQRDGVPWISQDAPAAMEWIENSPGWSEQEGKASKDRPIRLSQGRGTVAVHRGELELPRIFDPAAIDHVMAGLDTWLQAQLAGDKREAAHTGESGFVPSMFAVHRPDALNDPRNLHLHFLHGTRAVAPGEDGGLHFADAKVTAIAAKGWTRRLRCEAARLINVELERLDADYRLSPDNYAAMGIDASPQRKLDAERNVIERAGVRTDAGLANSREGWRRKLVEVRHRHIDAELELGSRDSQIRARIAPLDAARRKQLDAERKAALDAERRALRLRLEAEEIAIWIAMARSASEQTARFAPAYALKAKHKDGRDSYDAACWRTRGQEAVDYLAMLDRDLADERATLASRTRDAEHMMDLAARHWHAVETELARRAQPAPTPFQQVPTQRQDANQAPHISKGRPPLLPAAAVTHIARAPLMVTHGFAGYAVLPIDDPEGFLADVDLSGQQHRLKAVHEAQQKEMRQLVALVRKRGVEALEDEALDGQSDWLRRSAIKWRGSDAFLRLVARARSADWHKGDAKQDSLIAQAPSLAPPLAPEEARHPVGSASGLVLAPVIPRLPPVPASLSNAEESGDDRNVGIFNAAPAVPSPGLPAPTNRGVRPVAAVQPPSLSAQDRQFAEYSAWMQKRERERIETDMLAALTARVGSGQTPTSHAARLLDRVFAGFDPERVDRTMRSTGRTLDQCDADEILALRGSPRFTDWEQAARKGDPALRTVVTSDLVKAGQADPLGRVPLKGQRLDFTPGRDAMDRRTPRDWIERDLSNARLATIGLSREEGMVGVFDPRLLDVVHHNHVGLLYHDVQMRLEARWRLQRQEDEELLRHISEGRAQVDARLRHDRAGNRTWSQVLARGELADHPSMLRGRHDPQWYLACRKAQLGIDVPSPVRHPDHEVAAWLRARDEGASPALVAALANLVRAKKDRPSTAGLSSSDTKAVADIFLAPSPASPTMQRRRKRGMPPMQPGRNWGRD